MKKKIIFSLITILLVVLVTFILGEGLTRIYAIFRPTPKTLEHTMYCYSPYLPYVATPYYHNPRKNIIHNSSGFRNSGEFKITKPMNVYRIVCLGGSTTYSDYDSATNEQIWTGRLEYYLNKNSRGIKYEVINASAHNYTTLMNFMDYCTRIADLDVDMIIIYEGINELYFNGYDCASFAHYNIFKQVPFDRVNKRIDNYNHNYIIRNSELLKRIYKRLFLNRSLNEMATKESHYNSAKNIENMRKDSLLSFTKGLEDFIAISNFCKIDLIFLSQAYQYEKLKKGFLQKSFNNNLGDYLAFLAQTRRVSGQMEKIAKRYNIYYLDMNEILQQNIEYFYESPIDAVHFSIKGEDFFGWQVANFIYKNKILSE